METKTKRPSPRKITEAAWREMRHAFMVGQGVRSIARSAGVSEGTLLARASRERWSEQRAAALEKTRAESPHSVAIAGAYLAEQHIAAMASLSQRLTAFATSLPDGIAFDGISKIDTLDRLARRQHGLDRQQPAVSVNLFGGGCSFDDVSSVFEAVEA
jgi:hypothetical protein